MTLSFPMMERKVLSNASSKASPGDAPNAYPPALLPGQVTTLCFREVGTGGREGRPIQSKDISETFRRAL
jgi:hypothetical protein